MHITNFEQYLQR